MPVEFQGGVYRFGHSLVRPSYRANLAGDQGAPFFGMIFDPAGQGQADPIDLRGGARARRRFIGWQTFFDFGPTFTDGPGNPTPAIRPNKMVDTHISTPLFRLPLAAIATGDPPISLPQRNLLRHLTWSLPSGQSIARAIGLPSSQVLSSRDLADLRDFGHSLDVSTPLWYYVLKEGQVMEGGLRLGPVGGRIAFAAVAPDAANPEWSRHRRLHDDRLSHLCRRGARPARSVGASGPCGEALRTRGPRRLPPVALSARRTAASTPCGWRPVPGCCGRSYP